MPSGRRRRSCRYPGAAPPSARGRRAGRRAATDSVRRAPRRRTPRLRPSRAPQGRRLRFSMARLRTVPKAALKRHWAAPADYRRGPGFAAGATRSEERISQRLEQIRDVRYSDPGRLVIPRLPLPMPVVAALDVAEGRITSFIGGSTRVLDRIQREVQQPDAVMQALVEEGRHTIQLRRGEARATERRRLEPVHVGG